MKKMIKYYYLFNFRSGTVILIIMVASLGSVPHIWGSTLLTVTLSRLKITQQFVGVVTSLSLIASTVFTIILARLADIYFGHKLKKLILSLMPFHTIAMIALCVFILLGNPERNYQCKYRNFILKCKCFKSQQNYNTPMHFHTFLLAFSFVMASFRNQSKYV